jgi:hypothetical protein
VAVGIGGCLFIWFAKTNPLHLLGQLGGFLPSPSANQSAVDGVVFLAFFCGASFLVLFVFYFLAEATLLLADIAHNVGLLTRRTALSSSSGAHTFPNSEVLQSNEYLKDRPTPSASVPALTSMGAASRRTCQEAAVSMVDSPAAPPEKRCPGCGAIASPGAAFCMLCGICLR